MKIKSENGKVFLETGKFNLELNWLFSLLIDTAGKVADGLIKGEELSKDQQKLIQTVDVLAKIWGQDAVDSTETELDNEGLEELQDLFADTAEEGGFLLYFQSE